MKVICKSTKDLMSNYSDELFWRSSLTISKEYEVLNTNYISSGEYLIMNDYRFEHLYPVSCFLTKQELRENKLKELGI